MKWEREVKKSLQAPTGTIFPGRLPRNSLMEKIGRNFLRSERDKAHEYPPFAGFSSFLWVYTWKRGAQLVPEPSQFLAFVSTSLKPREFQSSLLQVTQNREVCLPFLKEASWTQLTWSLSLWQVSFPIEPWKTCPEWWCCRPTCLTWLNFTCALLR